MSELRDIYKMTSLSYLPIGTEKVVQEISTKLNISLDDIDQLGPSIIINTNKPKEIASEIKNRFSKYRFSKIFIRENSVKIIM